MELATVRYDDLKGVLIATVIKDDSLSIGRDSIVTDGNIRLRSHDRENEYLARWRRICALGC
jgi:hypothetical protein